MAATLISVVIDSYNYGNFIEQAIESVLRQDFPAEQLEIVVVDDGSTDDTSERVKKYGSRIRYVRKENGGQASAFNAGFANAQGGLIALLDADDFFLPGKLRRVREAFDTHPEAGMVYHKLPELHANGKMAPAPGFQELSGFLPSDKRKLASYSAHQTSCLAFRRAVLANLIPMPESMRIQADAYLELATVLSNPIQAIPEELAVYRIHGKNLCATDLMGKDPEGTVRVMKSTALVAEEVRKWASKHTREIAKKDVDRLLNRLMFPLLERQYALEPPQRWEYFRYLFRRNQTFSPIQTWPQVVFNYAAAGAALVMGYRRAHALKDWLRE